MQIIKSAYLECVIPSQNRRAFYLIQAEIDLYGFMLIRKWGRIGTKGSRPLKIRFQNREDLVKEFEHVLHVRYSRKYILRKAIEGRKGRGKIKIRIFNDNLPQTLLNTQRTIPREPKPLGCGDQRQLCLFKNTGEERHDQERPH